MCQQMLTFFNGQIFNRLRHKMIFVFVFVFCFVWMFQFPFGCDRSTFDIKMQVCSINELIKILNNNNSSKTAYKINIFSNFDRKINFIEL